MSRKNPKAWVIATPVTEIFTFAPKGRKKARCEKHLAFETFVYRRPASFRISGTLASQPRAMMCTPWQ